MTRKAFNFKMIPLLILFFWGIILFFSIHLQGVTFTVNTTDDTVDANPGDGNAADADGNRSLRAAIMEANALSGADTIEIPAGTYRLTIKAKSENLIARGDLDIRSNLTIQGAGKDSTVIDGNRLDRVFHIKGDYQVTIADLTITNGKGFDGIVVSETNTIFETGNPGPMDRGMSKDMDIRNIYYYKNFYKDTGKSKEYQVYANNSIHGSHGGGIMNEQGTLTIHRCIISKNRTGKGGRGVNTSGHGGNGGGIYNSGGTVSINDSEISGNSTGRNIDDNSYGNGGSGGGIFNAQGSLILNHCTLLENNCGKGSGGGDGGGIRSWKGTLSIVYCTFKFNRAGDSVHQDGGLGCNGGAISNESNAYISNTLIAQNEAGNTSFPEFGSGGGIFNGGSLIIENSTISGNIIRNSTAYGGGIFNLDNMSIESCTVINNTKEDIHGYYDGEWIISRNNIHNTIAGNFSGDIISSGYNLIGDTSKCSIRGDETGNIYDKEPKLGPLKNNGGPTHTHKLLKGSPAIDAGDADNYKETDQRGVYRPKDGDGDGTALPDIGAFENFTPLLIITFPLDGAKVWGTIEIKANANTKYVDFYIDNKKIHTDDSEPFSCTWATSTYSNSSHTIKAKGYESSYDFSAQDTVKVVKVSVDNTVISLHASRQVEGAWLIKRQYGKITFTIPHTGSSKPAKYVIERKEADGSFNSIAEVPASEVQGSSYTYNDRFLSRDITYTYRVTAYNSAGVRVGQSEEETI